MNDDTIDQCVNYDIAKGFDDEDCLKCDGYNATCHSFATYRTMYESNGYINELENTRIENAMKKIMRMYKLHKERKNRIE